MRISTNGEVFYGILLEEGEEEDLFNEDGEDGDIYETFKDNEVFKIINYCDVENPMWGIGIKESHQICSGGYPKELKPWIKKDVWDEKIDQLMKNYKINKRKIAWYLTSCWD